MSGSLLVARLPGEIRAARLDNDGRLQDYRIERGAPELQAGARLRGRVARIDRALGAAFVEIGAEAHGFLPLEKAPEDLTEGRALCLEVTRAPSPGKGAKLTVRGIAQSDGPVPERLGGRLVPLEGLEIAEGQADRLFDAHPAAVVRPDRYVFGVVDDDWSLDALVLELGRKLALR